MADPITSGSKKGMDQPPCSKPPSRVLLGATRGLHDAVEADELTDDDAHTPPTMAQIRAHRRAIGGRGGSVPCAGGRRRRDRPLGHHRRGAPATLPPRRRAAGPRAGAVPGGDRRRPSGSRVPVAVPAEAGALQLRPRRQPRAPEPAAPGPGVERLAVGQRVAIFRIAPFAPDEHLTISVRGHRVRRRGDQLRGPAPRAEGAAPRRQDRHRPRPRPPRRGAAPCSPQGTW